MKLECILIIKLLLLFPSAEIRPPGPAGLQPGGAEEVEEWGEAAEEGPVPQPGTNSTERIRSSSFYFVWQSAELDMYLFTIKFMCSLRSGNNMSSLRCN